MDCVMILDRLGEFRSISDIYQILQKILSDLNEFVIEGHSLPIFTEQLIEKLVPLICEDLIKTFKFRNDSRARSVNKNPRHRDKSQFDKVLDKIGMILLKLCHKSEIASERVIEMCFQHIENHPECTNTFIILIKLFLFSDQVKSTIKDMDAASIVVSLLEKICGQPRIMPADPSPLKQKHSRKASDFSAMLHQPSTPKCAPVEYRTTLNRSLISENDSFFMELPTLHGHTVSSRALRRVARVKVEETRPKSPVVPVLNIPPQDTNRSSKRADVQKSISYRSGRVSAFSGSWGENIQSPVMASPYGKETPKPNASQVFDFETSYIAEESTNYHEVVPPTKIICNLALQLGEACLTADLTALICQKRDMDLEKIAKLAAFPGNAFEKKKEKIEKKPKKEKKLRSQSLTSLYSPQHISQKKDDNLLFLGKHGQASTQRHRTTVLSFLLYIVQMYEPNELQFIKNPLNILFAHVLSSDYTRHQNALLIKNQESGVFSDDENELYEEDQCCTGEDLLEKTPNEIQTLEFLKEEAEVQPSNTVPGMSPRGVHPHQEERKDDRHNISINYENSYFFGNESSGLEFGFYQVWSKRTEEFLIPEHTAIFALLTAYAQYTESVHRQAITPSIATVMPNTSSSQMYEAISPKKSKGRSPNISMALSMMMEDPYAQYRETTLWINGVGWRDMSSKERLRKKSDLILYRLSRRLLWVQESYSGAQLAEAETELFMFLSRYLRICRSRISFFQTVDLIFEQLLVTKKSLLEHAEWPGSRPGSPTQSVGPSRQLGGAFLDVISQLLIQSQTIEAYKLLYDVFVGNDSWNECTKIFTLSLLSDTVRSEARSAIKYYNAISVFLRKIVNELQLDRKSAELISSEKNWKENIRRVLGSFAWLISPMKGIIPKFLYKHSYDSNFTNLHQFSPPPRNLHVTRSILELLENLYWFSPRFTNYRNEEYALHYIRVHYISFLKLYTNNQPKQVQEEPLLNATVGNHISMSSVHESAQTSAYFKACQELCKLHLRCLFAYARNRTPDVTRKFFQYRILDFLTREISLEYDITLRRERFIELRKAEKERVKMKFRSIEEKKVDEKKIEEKIEEKKSESDFEPISVAKKPLFKLDLKNVPKRTTEAYKSEADSSLMKPTEAPSFKLETPNLKKPEIPFLKLEPANPDIKKSPEFPSIEPKISSKPPFKIPTLNLPSSITSSKSEESKASLKIPSLNFTPDLSQNPPEAPQIKVDSLVENLKPSPLAKKPLIPSLKIGSLTQDPEKKEIEKQEFVKQCLEGDGKKHENYELTRIQTSLDGTQKMQLSMFESKQKSSEIENQLDEQEMCKENEFYEQQRKQREIYSDADLQASILALIFCLLLTPTRGTLEELYCAQHPSDAGKSNVLFLLHHHINHPLNVHILPELQKLVGHIVPPLAGQRLLKLLSIQFFDSSMYQNWKKIGIGAYGTVYECSTGLGEPITVAIKKMPIPKAIHDRCVLHDIFTEIACLEEFRLERCVTDLYDYGVDGSDYYIVMKRYPKSLKDWRTEIQGSIEENIPRFLTIYREVLKAVQIIHRHNVTHYDLKCDNVLLEDPIEDCQVTIGDFGECRMFVNSDDENCLANKGTEYIKSPEMLLLTAAVKKETDKYDRRRKVGTTRASDIWSLGCLLYELLTGDLLFFNSDWIQFFIRCTTYNEELLIEEKLEKIHNNIYLIDFLRYMLVRDPRHRPSIDNVLKRFEHLHALLVSAPAIPRGPPSSHQIQSFSSFEQVLDSCVSMMSLTFSTAESKIKVSPSFMRITHDVYLCSSKFLKNNTVWMSNLGITHIVHSGSDEQALRRFQNIMVGPSPLQSLAGVLDFLKAAHISKGRVAFVENEELNIRVCLLACLSEIFVTSFYETWSLINSQSMFFDLPQDCLAQLSIWTLQQSKTRQYLMRYPRYQCLCGSCTIILKRHLADPKYQTNKNCNCARQYRNVDTSDCPSPGCGDFLSAIKDMHGLSWDSLHWGFADKDDFLVGPLTQNKNQEQVILNSLNLDANAELFKVIEKRPWRSGADQWGLYKCKTCHMWIFAISNDESRVAYLTNINVTGIPPGIMSGGSTLSVPVLSKIKLPLLVVQKGSEMVKPTISYASAFIPTKKLNSSQIQT